MKKVFLFIVFLLLSCKLNTPIQEIKLSKYILTDNIEWSIFIEALISVESNGNPLAVGKTNDLGILQITPIYVKDVNRILGEDRFTLKCRADVDKSLEMFEIYQSYYNPDKNINKAIKLHNPRASENYRIKIIKQMDIIKSSLSYNDYGK